MKYYDLNNGMKIPALGLGVWQISDAEQCADVISFTLQNGYSLIDTATVYQNEAPVGEGIRRSCIPRDEIFVTSKLWVQDMGYERTVSAIDRLLTRMGLDYLDMYLIHHPLGDYLGSWKAMEEARVAGKIRTIGVANFSTGQIRDIMAHSDTVPAVNQIEFHPLCQQKALCAFIAENHIQLEAWSPLGSGSKDLLNAPILTAMAEKYGKNAGQIILRWHMQEGTVAIPKSVHEQRIRSNLDIWDFELTGQEMEQIRSMDTGKNMLGYDPENPGQWKDFLVNMVVES